MIRRPPRSTQSRSSAASDVYKRQFPLCAELYAEIRYEYRVFLANLCLAVHREDLIPWCFEYTPAPPPSTLLPSSWESGTTIFATTPRHIAADRDTSQGPLERVFLVGEDLLATSTNNPQPKRPVGHVHIHGHVRYVTFYTVSYTHLRAH